MKILLFLFFCFCGMSIFSQIGEKVIIKTDNSIGSKWKFLIEAQVENRPDVWIDLNNNGIRETDEEVLKFSPLVSDICEYTIKSQEITIYGKMLFFLCFSNNITDLDVSNSESIEIISCFSNKIQKLDCSKLKNLTHLYIDGNLFSACGLDSLFYSLPMGQIGENNKWQVYIKDKDNSNPGANHCRDTIATNKFWKVFDYNNDMGNIKIENNPADYTCPYNFSGISNIEKTDYNIEIYPNPANSVLVVKSIDMIDLIRILDISGRVLYVNTNCTEIYIPLNSFANGVYNIEVFAKKGTFSKKIIIEK